MEVPKSKTTITGLVKMAIILIGLLGYNMTEEEANTALNFAGVAYAVGTALQAKFSQDKPSG